MQLDNEQNCLVVVASMLRAIIWALHDIYVKMLWLRYVYAQEKKQVQADTEPKFHLNLHFGFINEYINAIFFPGQSSVLLCILPA